MSLFPSEDDLMYIASYHNNPRKSYQTGHIIRLTVTFHVTVIITLA